MIREIEIHDSNLTNFSNKIAKVNRRAEKNGLTERFNYKVVGKRIVDKLDNRMKPTGLVDVFLAIELEYPVMRIAGWEFLATVEFVEAGAIINNRPGTELPADFERPESHRCDHCGIKRNRKRSYIVAHDESGQTLQVGSTCIADFLGIEPKGLWLMEIYTAEEIAALYQPSGNEYDYVPVNLSVDRALRVAMILTSNGKKYVSKAKAIEWERSSTANDVHDILFPPNNAGNEYMAMVNETLDAASELPDSLIEDVHNAVNDMDESDYAMNMRTILASNHVGLKQLGFLVSAVSVYWRANNQHVESNKCIEYIGSPKERVKDIPVTVTRVHWFDTQYGMSAVNEFITDDNRMIIWFTGTVDLEVGQKFNMTATVKEHTEYGGNEQTVVNRAKLLTRE